MFRKIGEEKAFDAILNQIIDNIQDGNIKGGDALPAERTMAESMGVSRPAVREVLRALELLGIVHCVQGGGNYITEDLTSWLIGPVVDHVQAEQRISSAESAITCSTGKRDCITGSAELYSIG